MTSMVLATMNGVLDEQTPRTTTTVLDLPDEILGHIFLLNTSKEVFENPRDGLRNLHQTVLVCKRWHATVYGFPLLWGRVINYEKDEVKQVQGLLERSSPSSLDIGTDSMFQPVALQDPRAKYILSSLFEHRARIRTLNLKIRFSPWGFISKNFLQLPAPKIEFLNVVTSCPFPGLYHDGPLFGNEAPLLRRLHMERCFTNFSAPVLCNLTELSVSGISPPNQHSRWFAQKTSQSAPTPLGWLQALQNMPSLRHLTLSNSIFPNIQGEQESLFPAELNQLRLLSLVANFVEGTTLVDHLCIPSTCGVRFRLTQTPGSPHDGMPSLLHCLGLQLPSWQDDPPNRYLQAKILDGNRIHFGNNRRVGLIWNMTEEDELEEHSRATSDPMVWLVLVFPDATEALRRFDQLVDLYVQTYPSTTSFDFWHDDYSAPTIPFHLFHRLGILNLLESTPVDVLPRLQHDSSPSSPLLPSLRTLQLTRVLPEHVQSALDTFFRWQQSVGKKLPDIQFFDSVADNDLARRLRANFKVKVTFDSLQNAQPDLLLSQVEATHEEESD